MADLRDVLRPRVGPGKEYPSQRFLADKMKVAKNTIGSAMTTGKLDVYNCLRLVEELREPPLAMLRAGGKGKVATLFARLYGPTSVTTEHAVLIDAWTRLPNQAERAQLLAFLKSLAVPASEADGATPPKRPAAARTTRQSPKR